MGSLLVISGSGLSAESGLSTYRWGSGALWMGHDPERVCSMEGWRIHRDESIRFYGDLRHAVRKAEPNGAHRAMARWQRRWNAGIATQNIDDLLERAGCHEVMHVHGSLFETSCIACGSSWGTGMEDIGPNSRCPACGSHDVKPGVSYKGELAPMEPVLFSLIQSLGPRDAAVVIGTSCSVIPFQDLLDGSPARTAFCSLDPEGDIGRSGMACFDLVLAMPASRAIPRLEDFLGLHLGEGAVAAV